jgi:hypothetical protein
MKRPASIARWCVAALLTLVASSSASAAPCDLPRVTTVAFGNGMFTTEMEAMMALTELRLLVEDARPALEGEAWAFEIAYNETEPVLEQLIEVAEQRVGADLAIFWRMLAGVELAPDWLREEAGRIAIEVQQVPFVEDEDSIAHVARYRELLNDGSKVVLVAHSQGNLYANAAYATLFEREAAPLPASLGIVSVASPTDRVGGMGPHTTLHEDLVIAGVRAVFPSTLAGNVSASGAAIEPLGHGFTTAYLRVHDSRAQILEDVLTTSTTLPLPTAIERPAAAATDSNCADADSESEAVACEVTGWTGTCAATHLEPCWDAAGSCELFVVGDVRGTYSSISFENGARLSIVQRLDLDNPLESRSSATYRSSTGAQCAKSEIALHDDPTCVASTSTTSAAGRLSFCIDAHGTVRGICPDGSSFAVSASPGCDGMQPSCL